MGDAVQDSESAADVARAYSDEECLGELDEVVGVSEAAGSWVVAFVTQTFGEVYDHRVRVNAAGNVFSHERTVRSDEEEPRDDAGEH